MQIDDQPPSQENPQDRLRSTEEECERLRKENVRLRAMLGIPELVGGLTTLHSGSDREESAKANGPSTPEEKSYCFGASSVGVKTFMQSDGKEGEGKRVIRQLGSWTGVPFTQQEPESVNGSRARRACFCR